MSSVFDSTIATRVDVPSYERLREVSFGLVCGTWVILGILAILAWGPLGLIVLIPFLISVGVLYVWHFLWCKTCRLFRVPKRVGGTVLLAPAVVFACLFGLGSLYQLLPSSQYKRYVCESMPESVTAIRIGGDEAFLYEEKLLYFECAADDFAKILSEYEYQPSAQGHGQLNDLARKHLGMTLADLGPYDVFQADLLREHPQGGGTSLDVVLAVNKERTRAIFFHLYYN